MQSLLAIGLGIVVGVFSLYVLLRLLSKAVLRSYFEEKRKHSVDVRNRINQQWAEFFNPRNRTKH